MGNAGIWVPGIPERMFLRMASLEPPQRHCPVVRSGPRPPLAFSPWQDVQDFWNSFCPAEISAPCCPIRKEVAKHDTMTHRKKPMRKLYCIHETFVGLGESLK